MMPDTRKSVAGVMVDLVTIGMAAERLGISDARLHQLRKQSDWPEPVFEGGGAILFSYREVWRCLAEAGKDVAFRDEVLRSLNLEGA